MADVKHILVVDDHFEMLELLRSMLELSGHDYEVLAVPSAEEAMFELTRTHFDLLITDVRLPGMNGFDFVRRARRREPDIPVIMITGYTSEQGKQEAENLGVYRYFKKPLDADEVLTAVNTVLYGEAPPPEALAAAAPETVTLSDTVSRRLQLLRSDTGAASLVLASVAGQILLELGQQRGRDMARLIQTMAANVQNSFALGDQLGEAVPFTFQYHTGETLELYTANVGQHYFVTLFFSVESRRGRIGTIWVFAQRAIKELSAMLPAPAAPAPAAPAPAAPASAPSPPAAEPRSAPEPLDAAAPDLPPSGVTEADMEGLLAALDLADEVVTADFDAFWDDALQEGEAGAQAGDTLSFEQAQSLLDGLPDLPVQAEDMPAASETAVAETAVAETTAETAAGEPELDMDDLLAALNLAGEPAEVDLDAFWDEATQDDGPGGVRGLSFEEAQRRGLISPDIDVPEA